VWAKAQQLPAAVGARLAALPWPEISAALALLAGWSLITWSIASFSRTWQVWPLSAGLLLLSLFGWRFFYTMARDGLYALTREPKR
jgi:hypothetical protein